VFVNIEYYKCLGSDLDPTRYARPQRSSSLANLVPCSHLAAPGPFSDTVMRRSDIDELAKHVPTRFKLQHSNLFLDTVTKYPYSKYGRTNARHCHRILEHPGSWEDRGQQTTDNRARDHGGEKDAGAGGGCGWGIRYAG
jgi:hypothetical protein